MQNAIITSVLVSVLCGVAGALIVINRIVFLSGAIAHASYGGVGIAIFFGFSATLGGTLFAIFVALVISYVIVYYKERVDLFIGAFWSFGMALGIVLVDLKGEYSTGLMSYFFGSILAVSDNDIYYISGLVVFVLLVVALFYNRFVAISFDSEFVGLKGLNISFHSMVLMVICALCIVAASKVVGLIMVMALFTIPVFISEAFSNSLAKTMIYSSLISLVATLVGLLASYYLDLTPSAVIIIILVILLILFFISKRVINK
jgi:zinc transport system permease protein